MVPPQELLVVGQRLRLVPTDAACLIVAVVGRREGRVCGLLGRLGVVLLVVLAFLRVVRLDY